MRPELDRLCARLGRCRRLLVVVGAEALRGGGGARTVQVLREMERFYEAFLVVAEVEGDLLVQEGLAAVHQDGGCAPGSPLAVFLQHAPSLCLLVGARCSGEASALAVATLWRAGGWIVELGRTPSELAALARDVHRDDPARLLDDLWELFLTGSCDSAPFPASLTAS